MISAASQSVKAKTASRHHESCISAVVRTVQFSDVHVIAI